MGVSLPASFLHCSVQGVDLDRKRAVTLLQVCTIRGRGGRGEEGIGLPP